jgi:hypothetical protein
VFRRWFVFSDRRWRSYRIQRLARWQKLPYFKFRDFEERIFIEFGINRFEQLG